MKFFIFFTLAALTFIGNVRAMEHPAEPQEKSVDKQQKLDQALVDAILADNVGATMQALEQGAKNVDASQHFNYQGRLRDLNLIGYAALVGSLASVKLLAIHGASLAAYKGTPLLSLAVESGNQDLVAWLIERRANVNQADNGGYRPIDKAVEVGNKVILDFLRKRGAYVFTQKSSLFMHEALVVHEGQSGLSRIPFIQEALDSGYNINASVRQGTNYRMPLRVAADQGQLEIARWLIERGAIITPDVMRLLNFEQVFPEQLLRAVALYNKGEVLALLHGLRDKTLLSNQDLQLIKDALQLTSAQGNLFIVDATLQLFKELIISDPHTLGRALDRAALNGHVEAFYAIFGFYNKDSENIAYHQTLGQSLADALLHAATQGSTKISEDARERYFDIVRFLLRQDGLYALNIPISPVLERLREFIDYEQNLRMKPIAHMPLDVPFAPFRPVLDAWILIDQEKHRNEVMVMVAALRHRQAAQESSRTIIRLAQDPTSHLQRLPMPLLQRSLRHVLLGSRST